jgi:hypothetical protein
MADAPALGATVNRLPQRLMSTALRVGLMVVGAHANAAVHVAVVSGLGGEPKFAQTFEQWGRSIAQGGATATGNIEYVHRLAGDSARRPAIEALMKRLASTLQSGDELTLVLIGHGSFDGSEYRFNIPGPDITGTELATWLDRIPASVPQLVVNATSASGAVAERWARPHRSVITATRSGGERNAARFGGFWAEALVQDAADRDRDGKLTALEAYDFAVRKVGEAFKADASLVTEHARWSGARPERFVVARFGPGARFAGDTQLQALRAEQTQVEERLAALRPTRSSVPEEVYFDRLEVIALELARLGAREDARLAALAASAGAGDAAGR